MDATYKFTGKPAVGLKDVTPSNSADLPNGTCRGLLVTANGNLEIITEDGSLPTTFAVVAGQQLDILVKRVKTGTTATVKAIY